MNLRGEVPLTLEAILAKVAIAEEYYKSLEVLRFKKTVNNELVKLKKNNDSKTFTRKFFEKFNKEYNTFYKETDNIYCNIDTRRSIGDVFRAAYNYLGDKITLADIMVETYNKVEEKTIASNYCYQINKRVYKERGQTNGSYYDPTKSDELGFIKAHYQLLADHYNNK